MNFLDRWAHHYPTLKRISECRGELMQRVMVPVLDDPMRDVAVTLAKAFDTALDEIITLRNRMGEIDHPEILKQRREMQSELTKLGWMEWMKRAGLE